jgi:SPP1 gp7 family putative phage head morphogenesis protein
VDAREVLLGGLDRLQNMLRRTWSRAPDRAKTGLPGYFHTSPRLDPVRVIAKAAASVEWKLYSKKDLRANGDAADPIDDHELYELLENPCPTFPEIDGWTLRYITFVHRRLVGEFFWLKIRDERGHIVSLLPVPAAWVPKKPTVGDHSYLVYPYGVTASKALTVLPQDIVWFKDPDMSDPYGNGRGSTEAIADEIETDEYAAKYQKNYFHNDAMPPYIVSGEGITESGAKQIKESLMQKVAGWINARAPAVIGGKGLTITKLGDSSKEVDMIETRKFLRDLSLQHNQVPPEIYGIIENSNRSTIDASWYLFNKNVISYDLAAFERTVNNQLIVVDYGPDTILKHDKVIQEDEEFALKVYTEGMSCGAVMVDEFRTRFRLPELPGKAGRVFLRPMALVSVPADAAPEPAPKPATPAAIIDDAEGARVVEPEDDTEVLDIDDEDDNQNDDDENPEGDLDIDDDDSAKGKSAPKLVTKSASRREAIWKTFDAKATSGEPLFTRAMKTISVAQRDKVKSAIKSAVQRNADEAAISSALAGFFTPAADAAVKRSLAPAWIEMMKIGNAHALEVLGLSKAYHVKEESGGISGSAPTVVNSWFNKWIDEHGLDKAKGINDTTNKALHDKLVAALSDSVESGESLGNIIKKLMTICDGVYDDMDTARAKLIARTETGTSVNFGSYATYKTEGVEKKEWISTMDDRTRDDHADADGQVVGIDDTFDVGSEQLAYPGDPDGSAANICNCRCALSPVVGNTGDEE